MIDSELTKVEKFTLEKVTELRQKIQLVEQTIGNESSDKVTEMADDIAQDFLRVEKYVNINFNDY